MRPGKRTRGQGGMPASGVLGVHFQMQVSLLVSIPSLKNVHRFLKFTGDVQTPQPGPHGLPAGCGPVPPPTLHPRPAPTPEDPAAPTCAPSSDGAHESLLRTHTQVRFQSPGFSRNASLWKWLLQRALCHLPKLSHGHPLRPTGAARGRTDVRPTPTAIWEHRGVCVFLPRGCVCEVQCHALPRFPI